MVIGGDYGQDVVTFPVDAVDAVTDRLPAVRLDSLYPDALTVGGDPAREVIAPDGVHPLLGAVGRAFAEHRPLVLSPDAVWLTIAQGLAQHVRLHAERLRPQLVSHAGRKRLSVTVRGPMPQDADSWAGVVEVPAKQLTGEVDDADLFACDFSTSTPVERTAAQVVLLDAYSPYFTYWLMCVCGDPYHHPDRDRGGLAEDPRPRRPPAPVRAGQLAALPGTDHGPVRAGRRRRC